MMKSNSIHQALLLILFSCFLCPLTSCRTLRTSEKAVSESETASVTESRLTFYRTLDSLSRQLSMSADSVTIIFTEFPTAFPSGIEGCTETPSDSNSMAGPQDASRPTRAARHYKVPPNVQGIPKALKIYGLHLNENIEKKSIEQAVLKDSVAAATQSQKSKTAYKQSSKPSSIPKYIFYILVLVCVLYGIYRLRHR